MWMEVARDFFSLNRFSHPQSSSNNALPFFSFGGTFSPLIPNPQLSITVLLHPLAAEERCETEVWLIGGPDPSGHRDWFKNEHVTQSNDYRFPLLKQ